MDQGGADEVPLRGGRFTPGVVRVGETVRRPASSASGLVARLLTHLGAQGFTGCPRHLGRDESGRDVLSYIAGDVPARWRRFDDDQIAVAASMLRRLHDASRELAVELGGQVVCHHDPGPHNTVFRDGRPVAFIDFDFAAAGDRLEDVAYLSWSWCISSRPDREPVAGQASQVRLVAHAYGLGDEERRALPAAIDARLCRNETFWAEIRDNPQAPRVARDRAEEVIEWTRRELAYIRAHREVFAAALE
ncbi:phosphotransferase [Natronosporangium hydrolyticum]|uniref:Phosphotransferase n=1 Tax=Natronosporangium hydrolyticum TaxID=2811111 RepID=A0A895YFG4_9ACTN|nr:phosphotransferase [Natronosporangium hydrolyticum]QSB13276.1 phosphotransferase [Natronosporangium hydrolyticum]